MSLFQTNLNKTRKLPVHVDLSEDLLSQLLEIGLHLVHLDVEHDNRLGDDVFLLLLFVAFGGGLGIRGRGSWGGRCGRGGRLVISEGVEISGGSWGFGWLLLLGLFGFRFFGFFGALWFLMLLMVLLLLLLMMRSLLWDQRSMYLLRQDHLPKCLLDQPLHMLEMLEQILLLLPLMSPLGIRIERTHISSQSHIRNGQSSADQELLALEMRLNKSQEPAEILHEGFCVDFTAGHGGVDGADCGLELAGNYVKPLINKALG
jgi:hypothetical protein